jgi:lipoate-protein ligase A
VNGGGPIYAGAGSAFLVFFLPLDHPEVPGTTEEAFPKILTAIAEVFAERYGFPAEYRPLNDIQVEGRKLVPTSLKIENGVMTLRVVINVKPIDTTLAGKAMPMPPEKVRDKALKTLESRFTCLEQEAGREIDADELTAFAVASTARAFGETDLERAEISDVERAYAEAFRAELDTEAWLFGKSERTRFAGSLKSGDTVGRGREKAVGGMIRTTLAVRDGTVIDAIVNGDWHPRPLDGIAWMEQALTGCAAETGALRAAVDTFLAREDVEFAGVTTDDMMVALDAALADQRPWSP